MVQIPDSVRPALAIIAKYHFWMLAAVVPLMLVPLLFMANGKLRADIASARSQIDSRFTALRSVDSQTPHPNEAWSTKIVANTKRTKRETLAAWTAFWQSQEPLRQWPVSLGADFVQRAATLRPDGTLPRKLLERYQDGVRQLVRELPKRMGADEHMRDESTDATGLPVAAPPGAPAVAPASRALVEWNPENQRAIYESFNWQKPPSTVQVVLAQEELWLYGMLCDTIARMNRTAAGRFDAPITTVTQLAIGYPAAEDVPGGAGRIIVPATAPGGAPPGGEGMSMDMAPPEAMPGMPGGAGVTRPPHPRFGGGAGMPAGPGLPPPGDPAAEGGAPAASPDDPLKNWVYVDFDGKPLMAADLTTNPAAQMVHLMPFVLRLTMDQRSLDALLVDLAAAPIPIDVRQVRINVDSATAAAPGMMAGGGGGGLAPAGGGAAGGIVDRPRLHDIRVEIRGTIGLATPPNPQVIGLEPADLQDDNQPAEADAEAPQQPAADNEAPAAAVDDEAPVAVPPLPEENAPPPAPAEAAAPVEPAP